MDSNAVDFVLQENRLIASSTPSFCSPSSLKISRRTVSKVSPPDKSLAAFSTLASGSVLLHPGLGSEKELGLKSGKSGMARLDTSDLCRFTVGLDSAPRLMPLAEADLADKASVSIAKKYNERLRNSNALKTTFLLDAGKLALDLRKNLISSHIE
jgi:hypothetical protein